MTHTHTMPSDGDFHAFPVSTVDGFTQHGMTARDWFAGLAMQGLIASAALKGEG